MACALTPACVTGYDLSVRDPGAVQVREPLTGVVVIPSGRPPGGAASRRARLMRRADGSVVLTTAAHEEVILSAAGLVDGRVSSVIIGDDEVIAATTMVSGTKSRPRRELELVTPRSNVLDVREREAMNEPLGIAFAANGVLWLALGSVFLFVPGLTVGKGSDRRPMTTSERHVLAGISAGISVGFSSAGIALLLRGNPSTSVLTPPAAP